MRRATAWMPRARNAATTLRTWRAIAEPEPDGSSGAASVAASCGSARNTSPGSERVAVRIGRAQQRLMAAHLPVGRAHDRLERAREATLRRVRDRDAIARLAESRRRKVIVAQPVKHGLEHHRNSLCVVAVRHAC